MLIRPDTSKVNSRFLEFLLKSSTIQKSLNAHASGSTVPHLRVSEVRELGIPPLPPLIEQRAIAATLGALDDKIAVNERISQSANELFSTLHQKAQSLAKNIVTLGDTVDLVYGKSLPKSKRTPGEIPVYGSGGQSGTHEKPLATGPGIIIGRKGTVGSVHWSEGDFFPIDTTFYVSPKSTAVSLEYIYFTLINLNLSSMNSDSAIPGLNRSEALARKIRIPEFEDLNHFTNQARVMFSKIHASRTESRTLASLRDTLLPQLMSGKLRVKDAEKIVEDNV